MITVIHAVKPVYSGHVPWGPPKVERWPASTG